MILRELKINVRDVVMQRLVAKIHTFNQQR